MKSDLKIRQSVIDRYRAAFAEHGRNEASLLWTKNKQSVRFSALCRNIPDTGVIVLDYGCGLADLNIWLKSHRPSASYVGVDAVPEFIEDNRRQFPGVSFARVDSPHDISGVFDHIVCSGVFNLNPEMDTESYWHFVQQSLAALFARAQVALHVDFLAPDVEYRQSGSYHQNISKLISFIGSALSRRYILDRSYMPYEFCVSVFKKAEIQRPRNIYGSSI